MKGSQGDVLGTNQISEGGELEDGKAQRHSLHIASNVHRDAG